ncbi:MAG: 50S ribosomal protein L35 [Candidatus Yonathbacteria bacterium]|nr:50S ribosomal protein L35 [Candidatus Yonathbacteria bacterium]
MKTNKSFSKRIKITGTGKLIARKPGFGHFNAKQSRTKQLKGRKGVPFIMSNKDRSRFLPNY